MEKKKLSKETMGELVNTAIVAFFGLCVVIGWFRDVFLRAFEVVDWFGGLGVTIWSICAILLALLGILGMVAAGAGAVLDFIFTLKGKSSALYKYIQGGGAALSFIVMVFGLKAINLFINICLDNSLFDAPTWFGAGSLVWVITIISVMKVVYIFMYKEKKEEEPDAQVLPPIED